MRILRIFGIVLIAAVVAASITTVTLVIRRPDQVGRGPIAGGGTSGGSLAAVQRALPSVVRVERGGPAAATPAIITPSSSAVATPASPATATPASPSPAPTSPAAVASPATALPRALAGGTGVVIDARGFVLTAEALVAGADDLAVAVPGGKTVPARVVASDPDDGLSLLKIEAPSLRALSMGGAAALDTGSGVVLLAAPGYPQVAVGAVASAHSTSLVADPSSPGRLRPLNDLLALDVASREGQLGAPVLDAGGRLAGLVVVAGSQVFAADMVQAQAVVQQILDSGHAASPSLGFQYVQLSASDAADIDVSGGVRVVATEPRAAAQGLASGDVVVSANGTTLDPVHPLSRILRGLAVKQAVTLVVRPAAGGTTRRTITLDVQLVSA
ncbi:MAG: hypothetical protein NVSMB17_16010 [Candidatus Dormibacteria bacterium]